MLTIASVHQYLTEHEVRKLTIGASGADLYEIDEEYILKHVRREQLKEGQQFECYQKESKFYQVMSPHELACIPEVFVNQCTADEIILLMKRYQIPHRDGINDDFLYRTMQALASVHSCAIPYFLHSPHKLPDLLTKEQINMCVTGWKNVLEEHPGCFDDAVLYEIAAHINDLITWHESAPRVLCHGDFHMDNLLLGRDTVILICDWQSVGCGDASGDLSFFISRLDSEGIAIEKEHLVSLYSEAVSERSGAVIDQKQVLAHMYAANVITSFIFWHEYLHGSSAERIERVYTEMKDSYHLCINQL